MILKISGYPITTQFGAIDSNHVLPHKGIDFATPVGTPVQSIGDGIVTQLTDEGGVSFGKAIHVHMSNGDDVIYGHLSAFKARVGEKVHTGDVIGLTGNTGDSTGPHVHIQVMHSGVAVDPSPFLQVATSQLQPHDPSPIKDFIEKLFGIPYSWVDTTSPNNNTLTHEIAQVIQQAIGSIVKEIGRNLLHFSPYIMLVVCMGSILGMMVGSNRCRHWAGVSGLATLILKAVDQCIPY